MKEYVLLIAAEEQFRKSIFRKFCNKLLSNLFSQPGLRQTLKYNFEINAIIHVLKNFNFLADAVLDGISNSNHLLSSFDFLNFV